MLKLGKGKGRYATYVASLVVALLAIPAPAVGYKVWPYPGVHEAITLLAQQCALEAAPGPPADCRRFAPLIAGLARSRDQATYGELQIALRWADDPARQVTSTGLINYGVNMLANCQRIASRQPTPNIDTIGILCSSHYGRLQFLHAMASARGERTEDTRAKILDWADLTYRLAIADLRGNTGWCSYFERNSPEIASAFELATPGRCDSSSERPWTLSTLFNWRCTGVLMGTCYQMLRPETVDVLASSTAAGALLHAIQDSYSQSHAVRGPVARPFRPRVSCEIPTSFYNYLGQQGHADADYVPEFDGTCDRSRNADDVITASAMAIYHMRQRSRPATFSTYLQDHVLGRRVAENAR